MPPPIRLPVQVWHSADVVAAVRHWKAEARGGRGAESRTSAQRLKELARLEAILERKPFFGRNVPKNLIPSRLAAQGIANLFRNDLPDGWRMLHTFIEVDSLQVAYILAVMSHEDYDKLFGYRGR